MTWEETIRFIRTKPEYKSLVEQSYLGEDLRLNAERFIASEEFAETIKLIREFAPDAKTILDIGAGNGISSVALAVNGYSVTAIEPDHSSTVGCGAMEVLKNEFKLENFKIISSFGEKLPFGSGVFDIVYARQAMHHAAHLDTFIKEAGRVLRAGGILLTVRDHVIFNPADKQEFLNTHPLQKFYGGENAFTPQQYLQAMKNAGLGLMKHLKYWDSIINYFPVTAEEAGTTDFHIRENFRQSLKKRFGSWVVNFPFLQVLEFISRLRKGEWTDERRIPGRLNSFIAKKNPL